MQLKCTQCGVIYKDEHHSKEYLKRRKFCSRDCFKKAGCLSWFKIGHKSMIEQDGSKNYMWKGDDVGYSALHKWIKRTLGKANKCEMCGDKTKSRYEWASKQHKYLRDKNEWISLCCKCHNIYDKTF